MNRTAEQQQNRSSNPSLKYIVRERLHRGEGGYIGGRGLTGDDTGALKSFGQVHQLEGVVVLAFYGTRPYSDCWWRRTATSRKSSHNWCWHRWRWCGSTGSVADGNTKSSVEEAPIGIRFRCWHVSDLMHDDVAASVYAASIAATIDYCILETLDFLFQPLN
jgi:hypothetical protein